MIRAILCEMVAYALARLYYRRPEKEAEERRQAEERERNWREIEGLMRGRRGPRGA